MSRVLGGIGGTLLKATVGLGVAGFIGTQCIYNVPAGHRGLIFQHFGLSDRGRGILDVVEDEGTHFIFPFAQEPRIMEVRTQPRVITTETPTKDMQRAHLSIRLLARPSIDMLPSIYRELGEDYAERVLPSANEVLKAVVAQYNAASLLTLRDQVSLEIRETLKDRLSQFNIVLDDVAITDLEFSRDFSRAIENKQVAEQMAERAKFEVAKAEQERQARIIRAEGDAEASQLVSDAIAKSGRALVEIRRIETALTIADTLAHSRGNVTYLPSSEKGGSNMLLNLNKQ